MTTPSLRFVLREEGMTPVKGQRGCYEGFGLFGQLMKGPLPATRDCLSIAGNERLDSTWYPGGRFFFDNDPDKLRAYIKDHKERLNKKENGE